MKENWQLLDYIDSCNKCCKAALESIPICLFILIVLLALIGLWYLLVLIGLKELMINFAQLMIDTEDPSVALANWLTAIVSLIALWGAWKAYHESKKARKSAAFSTLFAQLINNHNSIFRNAALSETGLTNESHCMTIDGYELSKDNDIITNFYRYCIFRKDYILSKRDDSEEISKRIIGVWYHYVDRIKESAKFNHCFKYVYYEKKTVLEGTNEKSERKHYLGIIQANMSHAELFSYFFNLLQYYLKKYYRFEGDNFVRIAGDFDVENDDIVKGLKTYYFFYDLSLHSHTHKFVGDLWRAVEHKNNDPLHRIINAIIKTNNF